MQFKDGNRIDLTLMQSEKFMASPRDSQSILLLNKDLKLGEFGPPNDNDYLPKQPTKKEFNDCCNEFLWVSTYVAKGIARKQLTYAKTLSEKPAKEKLIKLLIWYAGIKTNFQKTVGAYGKYLEKYLEPEVWNTFCKTYVDADYENMWEGLFVMCELFNKMAIKISEHYDYPYDQEEYRNVLAYLKDINRLVSAAIIK
jgi:aminoglycoside 6-adenylyltransferase